MEMLSRPHPLPPRRWLFGTLALLTLTGCATHQLAEGRQPAQESAIDVGYGSINQDHLVGSVSTVQGDEGPITRSRTMIEMLARLPGVQVKESGPGGISVLVRGARPLFVVDGMIFKGSIDSINPNTIESISVLKNPGETAIYGSQVGHGGVILIRRKTGG